MDWNSIFSEERPGGITPSQGPRTQYQRDFDRIVFSSAFRRLQNKTQVFPLPGSTFVHNRLTHSLEVASVGRSLAKITGEIISKNNKLDKTAVEFYKYELQNVIASACLAHDIGNPAFGHSGEKAISKYFTDNPELKSNFNNAQWEDLTGFEGNANALRILTHSFRGKAKGGLGLTVTTLAALMKYPCESTAVDERFKHRKKYGFFQSEKETAVNICEKVCSAQESSEPLSFKRHPFVYLTEAADDICYMILDMEDAAKLGIIEPGRVNNLFLSLIESIGRKDDDIDKIHGTFKSIGDKNEKITYLRAKAINTLTMEAAEIFINNSQTILSGMFNSSIVASVRQNNDVIKEIEKVSFNEIYNHDTVLQIEIAGYNVISHLLSLFVPAVLKEQKDNKDDKILRLVPGQFPVDTGTPYEKVMSVLDFVSGMTDMYATELYRKISGIDIPVHK